jgi:hypothetical protein
LVFLSLNNKYQPLFSFHIWLNLKDQDIIFNIHSFFNHHSRISTYKPHNEIRITFHNLYVINNYIIPHFDSYPLIGIKYMDYPLFKLGINLINNGDYKNPEGMLNLGELALLMNEGYKKKYY